MYKERNIIICLMLKGLARLMCFDRGQGCSFCVRTLDNSETFGCF
jgi:hypothetical protein